MHCGSVNAFFIKRGEEINYQYRKDQRSNEGDRRDPVDCFYMSFIHFCLKFYHQVFCIRFISSHLFTFQMDGAVPDVSVGHKKHYLFDKEGR
jgi:hypothetical protein